MKKWHICDRTNMPKYFCLINAHISANGVVVGVVVSARVVVGDDIGLGRIGLHIGEDIVDLILWGSIRPKLWKVGPTCLVASTVPRRPLVARMVLMTDESGVELKSPVRTYGNGDSLISLSRSAASTICAAVSGI